MFRLIALWSLLALFGCSQSVDQRVLTSTEAAPNNYIVEFENDYVRIIRVKYSPGESSAMHSHEPFVGVTLTGTKDNVFTYLDGSSETRPPNSPGELIDDDLTVHAIKSNADFKTESIFVELKKPYTSDDPFIPNLTEVAPDTAAVVLEKPGIRVVRVKNPADSDTPLHSHRAGVSIPLTDMEVEVTSTSGEIKRVSRQAGDASWEEPRAHSGKNLRSEPTEMLIFELI